MDDWEYENTDDDYWSDTGNETNPDSYDNSGGDYTGYTPGYENPNLETTPDSDYTGYTPGYENPNIATEQAPTWYNNLLSSLGGTNTNPVNSVNPMAQPAQATGAGGGISQMLGSIFGGGNLGTALKGGAALLEGAQNKQKAAALAKIANNTSATGSIDPWSSQRPFYQQQAQAAVTDPYSSPIVAAQVAQLQKAQNIKDAAAGRRSNSLMGSTSVMSEAAKIAQNYQAQMAQQGGSQVTPNSTTQANLLSQASGYDTNGYLSPIANALGYNSQSTNSSSTLQQLMAALNKMKAA